MLAQTRYENHDSTQKNGKEWEQHLEHDVVFGVLRVWRSKRLEPVLFISRGRNSLDSLRLRLFLLPPLEMKAGCCALSRDSSSSIVAETIIISLRYIEQ